MRGQKAGSGRVGRRTTQLQTQVSATRGRQKRERQCWWKTLLGETLIFTGPVEVAPPLSCADIWDRPRRPLDSFSSRADPINWMRLAVKKRTLAGGCRLCTPWPVSPERLFVTVGHGRDLVPQGTPTSRSRGPVFRLSLMNCWLSACHLTREEWPWFYFLVGVSTSGSSLLSYGWSGGVELDV